MLLAAAWPAPVDRVLIEADGSGGVVGPRYGLAVEPGVSGLVSQVRRGSFGPGFEMVSVARLLRRPSADEEGLWVVPAPLSAHESKSVWQEHARAAAMAVANDTRIWIADCGRVWPGSPVEQLLTSSYLNVIVSDDSIPALVVLQARVQASPGKVAVIVVGKSKYTATELEGFTGADLLWKVPYQDSLAERVGQLATEGRAGRRSKLWKSALEISHTLAADAGAILQYERAAGA